MRPPVEAEAGARGRWRAVGAVGGEGGRGRAWEAHYSESKRGKKMLSKGIEWAVEMSRDYAQEQFKLYS